MTHAASETDALDTSAILTPPSRPQHTRWRHYAIAAWIGLIVGLLATAFRIVLYAAEHGREAWLGWAHANWPRFGWVGLPIVGAILGLIVGRLLRLAPEAGGSGIPHLKAVMLGVRTLNYRRLLPVKFVGGVLSIGSGLALGREGPTVQMGAATAQAVAQVLRVPPAALPQLLSCGAGAGLAAAFNAPLAGVIFVIEELHRELSSRTFVGALIATIVATVVAQSLTGQVPSFAIRGYPMLPLWALPAVVVVGGLGGVLGATFNASLLVAQRRAIGQRVLPRWTLPAVAGLIVGIVAWFTPQGVGGGHGPAERLLESPIAGTSVAVLIGWLLIRFVMTVLSYASGAPGGIFAPMLLIGAILGSIVGHWASFIFPALADRGQAFAVVGMAAMFVGSVRAPLTGIVLICEMTANYEQLFALCIACLSAHLVAELLRGQPIYDALMEADLHRSGITPASEARTIYLGIQRGSQVAGQKIRNAGFPRGALITAIERSGRSIAPLADVELHAGDHITVAITAEDPGLAMHVVKMCLPSD